MELGLGSELPAGQSGAEERLFGAGKVNAVPLPVCPSFLQHPDPPTYLQDTTFGSPPQALHDHLPRSGKGLSPRKRGSALLLDIRDSMRTSLLGEAELMGLCHGRRPVHVLVVAAGSMAVVCAGHGGS